ncbi:MAG TPA: VOC family protein [Gemmatimonadaceae bacterium]|jgi:methylmalonyl-CoA/ethylmalonyl-CoA epimerase|nr:VOC family protein [Gemmatimonadaceae bacterium]
MRLHHVGIVVDNIEGHRPHYCQFFGLEPISEVVTDETQRVNVQFLASRGTETSLELIEPLPGESPVRRALEKGNTLNHLCFEVGDIDKSVDQAVADGAMCIRRPVPAAAFDGRRIAFVFYRGIGLVEFVEAPAS